MASMDSLLGATASWAAAAVFGYLALGLAASFVAHRAGALRRCGDRLLLLYPPFARAALRAVVVSVLGVGAASPGTSALAATPERSSSPRPPVVAPAHPGVEPLDWPVPVRAHPVTPRTASSGPTRREQRAKPPSATVTVEPGDCLWSLAARALGPHVDRAEIAAAWPRWWAANRDVIGADPDVLHPGERLRLPAAIERSAS